MIRLLIADDSPVFRHFLRKCVAGMEGVEVAGEARHGEDALARIAELKPDVMTLDMTMPRMNGMQVLHTLRKDFPDLPAIVLTSGNESEAERTVEALDAGAFDFILKPQLSDGDPVAFLIDALYPRIMAACKSRRRRPLATVSPKPALRSSGSSAAGRPDLVAIGSSTGGPAALHAVLGSLPDNFPVPVVVTQHMPKLFLQPLADRLEKETALSCHLAVDGMTLERGHIYVAPGESHLELQREGVEIVCRLSAAPPVHHCRPAVDPMFYSLAALAPRLNTLAVVLTGMGEDGAAGAKAIAEKRGHVIAQDEKTSVVWGMPGATVRCGAAHEVLPLEQISAAIMARCARTSAATGVQYANAAV